MLLISLWLLGKKESARYLRVDLLLSVLHQLSPSCNHRRDKHRYYNYEYLNDLLRSISSIDIGKVTYIHNNVSCRVFCKRLKYDVQWAGAKCCCKCGQIINRSRHFCKHSMCPLNVFQSLYFILIKLYGENNTILIIIM